MWKVSLDLPDDNALIILEVLEKAGLLEIVTVIDDETGEAV